VGFENRDYTREGDYTGTMAGWGLDYFSPVVKWLIIVNVAMFLLQVFVTRPFTAADRDLAVERMPARQRELVRQQQRAIEEALRKQPKDGQAAEETALDAEALAAAYELTPRVSMIDDWLALDTNKIVYRGQVWRLLTYAFCHDRIWYWHILLNMVALFWFGVTLETMYGQREFLLFYLCAAVFAGLVNVGLDLWLGSSVPAVGASGAVMAVLMLYAIHYPRNTIRIWFFPLEMRWLVVLYVITTVHPVLLALAGDFVYQEVAHAAHLGGLLFGFLYWKFDLQLERYWDKLPKWRGADIAQRSAGLSPVRRSAEHQQDQDVDNILRKIAESGEASLTDHERRTLQRASERYKRKLS
jgi:membrane associated rhomboid family serine protease